MDQGKKQAIVEQVLKNNNENREAFIDVALNAHETTTLMREVVEEVRHHYRTCVEFVPEVGRGSDPDRCQECQHTKAEHMLWGLTVLVAAAIFNEDLLRDGTH